MQRFTILLGGRLTPSDRLRDLLDGSRLVAADAGMRHAVTLGIVPELWIGDFDSDPGPLPEVQASVAREPHPADKDRTDGELAVDWALSKGATALVLAGAFGGPRTDHEVLHLTLAIRLAEAGIAVLLTSGDQVGAPLAVGRRQVFDWPDGTLFSVLAFSDLVGLTVEGAKWPLRAVDVPFGSSWTVSNEARGSVAITLNAGRALAIAHFSADGTV